MMQTLSRYGDVLSSVGPIFTLLVLLLLAIGVPTIIGMAVLGPINRAAGRLRAPTRFQLSDSLWLSVQVQIVLAYCVEFVGVKQRWYFALVLTFLVVAVLALWSGGMSFMSRAGVTHPPRRAVFILFLLPLTLALMMSSTLLMVAGVVSYSGWLSFSMEYRMQLVTAIDRLSLGPWSLSLGLFSLPLLGWGLRRASRWVIRGAEGEALIAPSPATPLSA